MDTVQLSSDEADLIAPIIAAFAGRARPHISLEYLLTRWRNFVLEVENGYRMPIFEYHNDLSVRNLLEDLLVQVPGTLQTKLLNVIGPWDVRFIEATREIDRPLLPLLSQRQGQELYWWYRVPKHLAVDPDTQEFHYWDEYYT